MKHLCAVLDTMWQLWGTIAHRGITIKAASDLLELGVGGLEPCCHYVLAHEGTCQTHCPLITLWPHTTDAMTPCSHSDSVYSRWIMEPSPDTKDAKFLALVISEEAMSQRAKLCPTPSD